MKADAAGQVLVHGAKGQDDLKRFIVIPNGDNVTNDIRFALNKLKISLLRFEMSDKSVDILD